jgi:N-acetylmuramoyl-L-alanine amidase
VVIKDGERPVDSAPYDLILCSGEMISGTTGPDGLVECPIPANLEQAVLDVMITRNESQSVLQRWTLRLGHLDPVDTVSGIQARLNNLGFDCGEVDGVAGPKTEASVRHFQKWAALEIDGIAGPKTQNKLKQEHGC